MKFNELEDGLIRVHIEYMGWNKKLIITPEVLKFAKNPRDILGMEMEVALSDIMREKKKNE